jgi:hypothetical protein
VSGAQYSTTSAANTMQTTPKHDTTRDEVKMFMQNLAQNHGQFCVNCKRLISDALSLTENNNAGPSGDETSRPAGIAQNDPSDLQKPKG